ncbi:secreted phosphoprotein 24 [Bombina bombina]|uniref:secreted phosphoprotein 24 n=1 Tax=Bombina bombina TaxID=8345 RepID=UPI00235A662F|nr:secreted phosphoprotein 24 [Bombina bombina]
MTRILLAVLMLMQTLHSSGLPVNDNNESFIRAALNASLAYVNSQSWGTNLLRVTKTYVKRVDYLRDSDKDLYISLEFGVRETTCNKNAATDPASCDFRMDLYEDWSCKSNALISEGQPRVLSAECHLPSSSSSESDSSEERMIWKPKPHRARVKQNSERFPSPWDPFGRRSYNENPLWEEESWSMPKWE